MERDDVAYTGGEPGRAGEDSEERESALAAMGSWHFQNLWDVRGRPQPVGYGSDDWGDASSGESTPSLQQQQQSSRRRHLMPSDSIDHFLVI